MRKNILYLAVLVTTGIFMFNILKPSPDTINEIRIGYNMQSLTGAAIIVASEKNYFKDYDLNVKLVPFKGGEEIRLALVTDKIDLGFGGFTDFIPMIARGVPIKIITPTSAAPVYIFTRPNENINTLKDLYEKTILVSAGGTNELVFRVAMSKEGIDTSRMKFIDLERTLRVPALMDQKISDASVGAEQDTEVFLGAGAVILPEWESKYLNQYIIRNSVAGNIKFLEENQELINKFIDAFADAHRLIKDNPEEAAKLVTDHIREKTFGAVDNNPDNVAEHWKQNELINLIWQKHSVAMDLVTKSKELGIIERDLSVEEVYDLRFDNKLKSLQEEIYGPQS